MVEENVQPALSVINLCLERRWSTALDTFHVFGKDLVDRHGIGRDVGAVARCCSEVSFIRLQNMLRFTYGTWEAPEWPAFATMRYWAEIPDLGEESAASAAGAQLEMRRVRKGCLLLEAVEVHMGRAWLGPGEEQEPGFEAVGSGPPGSGRICSSVAALMAEGCKAKLREGSRPAQAWRFPAGETGAGKRRGLQEE